MAERLPTPTPDKEQVKRDIDEFGYGILTDLLNADEIGELKDRLLEQAELEVEQDVAWLGNGGRGGNTWIGGRRDNRASPWQCVRTLLNKGRPFIDLALNPIIREINSHVLKGMDFYLSSTNGLVIHKGAGRMVVHNDQLFVPGETVMPFVTNVMIALSDFTEENGATRVVPKSHLGPAPKVIAIEAEEGFDAANPEPIETIPAECPAGSAIFFEGRLWHESGEQTSDDPRISISTYYALPFIRQQDCYPASMQDEVYESLTKEERAMFGFKTGPWGRMDPRSPGDRTNTDVHSPFIPELRRGSDKRAVTNEDAGTFGGSSRQDKILLDQEV